MHVRCPQCHDAMEVAGDTELSGVVCPTCGSSFNLLPTTATYTPTTRTIGHFQLLEQLGTGGFGSVWKARDNKLDRLVAIKIPRGGQVDDTNVELFLREARASAQLKHSGIVSVHEVGREDGTVYIVSDLIQGVTLADRLTTGPFAPREAAELCAQVAEALHHAHEAGVIHRDLKPSNIMLDGEGLPHVMDFGLARRETGEITMTVEGKVLGTAGYMSPEQARGEGHTADRRTDVYSLGVILFQLLTGERPFRGNERMLLHQVLHDESPSPRKLNSRIPRDLETICLKCLQKSPERRYHTTELVAGDLRRWLEGKPILARPVGRAERLVRWARRQPVVAGLSGSLAVLLLAAAMAGTATYVRVANDAAAKTKLASRSIAIDSAVTEIGGGELLIKWETGDTEAVFATVEKQAATPLLLGSRQTLGFQKTLANIRGGLNDSFWKDDKNAREFWAVLEERYARRADGLKPIATLGQWELWSQDSAGKLVAHRFDGAESRKLELPAGRMVCLQWLRAGTELYAAIDDQIWKIQVEGTQTVESVARLPTRILCWDASDDGQRWAWSKPVPAATVPDLLVQDGLDGPITSIEKASDPAWFADGRRLTYLGGNNRITIWDGKQVKSFRAPIHATMLVFPRPSPDGQVIAFAMNGTDGTRQIGVISVDGKQVRQVTHSGKGNTFPIFSPDGRYIAYIQSSVLQSSDIGKHDLRVVDLETDEETKVAEDVKFLRPAWRSMPYSDTFSRSYANSAAFESALETLPLIAQDDVKEWKVQIARISNMRRQLKELGASEKEDLKFDGKLLQTLQAHVGMVPPYRNPAMVPQDLREYISEQALVVAEHMAKIDPKGHDTLEALARSHHYRGDFFFHDKPAEAVPHYQQALASNKQLIAEDGINTWLATNSGWTCSNLARSLMKTKPTAELFPLALRSVELREYMAKNQPEGRNNRNELEVSYEDIAKVLAHWPEVKDADLQKATQFARERTVKDPTLLLAWRALGVLLARQKQYEEAAQALRKSNEGDLPEKAYDLFFLAISLEHSGKHDEAKDFLARGSTWLAENQPDNKLLKSLEQEAIQVVGAK